MRNGGVTRPILAFAQSNKPKPASAGFLERIVMHTKEPWFSAHGNIYGADQYFVAAADFGSNSHVHMDDNGLTIDRGLDIAAANTSRIVACVNACAGIPDDDLEKFGRWISSAEYGALEQQRNELLTALETLCNRPDSMNVSACRQIVADIRRNA